MTEDLKDSKEYTYCLYCGDAYEPSLIAKETSEDYSSCCVPCISDFIDFFIQHNYDLVKDLPDEQAQVGQFFLNYRDEWRLNSNRVK